jgi:hypothetical protein
MSTVNSLLIFTVKIDSLTLDNECAFLFLVLPGIAWGKKDATGIDPD